MAHIEREHVYRVARAYLDAPPRFQPPATVAAYAQLADQCGRWYVHLTSRARQPVRVVFTRCREPYATGAEVAAAVRHDRVLELCPTRCDRDRRHPLIDTSVGGAYDRVRAVHDIVSHGWLGHGFDPDGELSAWLAEDSIYRGLARWALATELHAHHCVLWTTGEHADHKAVLLDPELLRAARAPGMFV